MAFCTTCGGRIAGRFCEACGAPAPGAAAQPPVATPSAMPPPPAAAPQRKTSPLVWILGGLAVIFLLCGVLVVAGGMFVFHKAKQAGLDPALWERNPGLAATKMLAAANPDAEIVSMDERGGVVVVRDRKTGKTIRMNFADLKRGRMTLEADGEKVSIASVGDGSTSAMELQSKDGTARIGAGAAVKLPAWLPAYAGAKDAGGMTSSGPAGDSGVYGFKTADSPAAVMQFYQSAFEKAGFTVHAKVEAGDTTVLSAESAAQAVQVGASAEGGQTTVSVSFSPKNK